ncbi:ATPase [Putridiphycobacter roseus]|uniref:ATPase n=1 Tax=Putridiphycobacter roseus TaxID=2219161 RepID=A0A2W1N028_9FLAO|nr:ATP-binding protein [Putridiphycobacter roseus]PZE16251.1 ATPase [Putridiphycobacter roseus]
MKTVYDLTIRDKNAIEIEEIQLNMDNKQILTKLLKEYKYIKELSQYNLNINHKLLLHGHTGCGKTTTAKAIAKALGKKIVIVNLSNLISSKLGETAQNIQVLFEKAANEKAVLFLDEFDYIGKARDLEDTDAGEMKRLVNNLIQLIDYYPTDAILIAATNHLKILDAAIRRRFQINLKFELPTKAELDVYYANLLSQFPVRFREIKRSYEISYAEAKDRLNTQVKWKIIEELEQANG